MAKFYTLKTTAGGLRYFITKSEAVAALDLARAGASAGGARVLKNGASISADRVPAGKNSLDIEKSGSISKAGSISISMAGSMAGSKNRYRCLDVDGEVDEVDIDEVDVRSMAAQWLNLKAVNQENAFKREANKTAQQRSDNMRKAWKTRRKNTES